MEPSAPKPLALVVDDDPDTRELYRLVLDIHGYRAAEAADVEEAVRVGGLLCPDVIISDWMLPDGDGLSLAQRLRSVRGVRSAPLIAITGLSLSAAGREDAARAGFRRVLLKPVLPDTMIKTVEQVLVDEQSRLLRVAARRIRRHAFALRRKAESMPRGAMDHADQAREIIARTSAARTNGRIAILIADDDARYVAANVEAKSLTGYDDLLDLSVWDLTPIVDLSHGRELWGAFIASGMQEGRYTLCRRDGERVETQYCAVANIAPGLHASALSLAAVSPVAAMAG